MSNVNENANWYTTVFKSWQAKLLGPKPTAEQLHTVHMLGARPGKQALASAMALRECGVTGAQIVIACGAPQLNKMRGFITDSLLKREAVAPSPEGHRVYKLSLTAKGSKRVEQAVARAAKAEAEANNTGDAKPAKAKKAASKPHKAKVSKGEPETVTVDGMGNPVDGGSMPDNAQVEQAATEPQA